MSLMNKKIQTLRLRKMFGGDLQGQARCWLLRADFDSVCRGFDSLCPLLSDLLKTAVSPRGETHDLSETHG